jgi:hypothetical protein
MIRLATGVTPNYLPRASVFLESLRKCNVETSLFCVNFDRDPPGHWHINNRILVDYSKATVQLPKFMLQHGGFVQFAPGDWSDNDVIIFTDADAVLQRPFTPEELKSMELVGEMEMQVGYNRPNERQTLAQEAPLLSPNMSIGAINAQFPGIDQMECRNFGFVVGRLSAWRELFTRTVALEPRCASCFGNPARVQFMCCYALQRQGLRLTGLSPVIHAHGHIGLRNGLKQEVNGVWTQDGEVVAFAHAL